MNPSQPTPHTPRARRAQPDLNGPAYPSAPRRTPRTPRERTGASTPATVWACQTPPIDPDDPWPTALLDKIVTSFTTPHDEVVLLDLQATTRPKPATRSAESGGLATAQAAVSQLDRTVSVTPTTAEPSTRHSPGQPRPGFAPDGIPDTPLPRLVSAEGAGKRRAHLVIASLPPQHADARTCDHLAQVAARLLRTGGILAVLTHTGTAQRQLIDPTGSVVAAAQSADLLYLQHIVALLVPIRHGRLHTDNDHPHGSAPSASARPVRHRRVHSDVLVFAQPHQHADPLPQSGPDTGAIR
ncbi:hypothetical protein [Saccharopolyspora sp. ASAGF58]|uniref:hypothetical protein n=1 Tax=Saccharopolyspora sp. ASAGF58 TaxID=2719023 RepID=UPI001FF08C38|nr:hypothetical protein [Saccharopolyspora sp. ASAGF58]